MSRSAPKSFHVKSFGCQMNVYDGERMAEMLGAEGYVAAAEGADADLVVLNTCHIREKAAEKVYSDIGRLKRDDGSRPTIAVAGCVAQAESARRPAAARSMERMNSSLNLSGRDKTMLAAMRQVRRVRA